MCVGCETFFCLSSSTIPSPSLPPAFPPSLSLPCRSSLCVAYFRIHKAWRRNTVRMWNTRVGSRYWMGPPTPWLRLSAGTSTSSHGLLLVESWQTQRTSSVSFTFFLIFVSLFLFVLFFPKLFSVWFPWKLESNIFHYLEVKFVGSQNVVSLFIWAMLIADNDEQFLKLCSINTKPIIFQLRVNEACIDWLICA